MTDFYWDSTNGMSHENAAARARRDVSDLQGALVAYHVRLVCAESALQASWEAIAAAQKVLEVFRAKGVPAYSDEAHALARLARALEGP